VQTCSGFGRSAELAESGSHLFQQRQRRTGERLTVGGEPCERSESLGRVEVHPCVARFVREATTACRAPILPTERGSTGAVQFCELATEVRLRGGAPSTLVDPLEDEMGWGILVTVEGCQHLRYRQNPRLTEPGEAGRLGGEEPGRRPAVSLGEHRPVVGQRTSV
jgi:hypothetical protein